MSKTPNQIKNMVEEWAKLTGAPIEDVTELEKAKQPKLEWVLRFNKVLAAYMISGRPDRVTLEVPISFAPEHQQAATELPDKEFLKFIIEILEPLAIAEIIANVSQNQKQIKQINLQTYADVDSLTRENFFRRWDKIAVFRELVIKKIQVRFGVKGMVDGSTTSGNIYG